MKVHLTQSFVEDQESGEYKAVEKKKIVEGFCDFNLSVQMDVVDPDDKKLAFRDEVMEKLAEVMRWAAAPTQRPLFQDKKDVA